MAKSTFRSRIFWRWSRSLNACTNFSSRSLYSLDCELKSVVATDSRSNSTSFSWWVERLDTWPTPVSRELVWPNRDETLLTAALRLLLNASEFGIPLALPEIMVTPEIRVVVGDVDRIVLWVRVIGEVGELGWSSIGGQGHETLCP